LVPCTVGIVMFLLFILVDDSWESGMQRLSRWSWYVCPAVDLHSSSLVQAEGHTLAFLPSSISANLQSAITKLEIEQYLQCFQFIAPPLLKQRDITVAQRNFHFVSGIPSAIKNWFITRVPESRRTCSNPISLTDLLV
jgi:hypothetical protein